MERTDQLVQEQMMDALEGREVIRDALIVITGTELAMYMDGTTSQGYVSFVRELCIPKTMYLADITENRTNQTNPVGTAFFWTTYPETIRKVTGHKLRKLRKKLNPLPKKNIIIFDDETL